jgi:hypothetical protein
MSHPAFSEYLTVSAAATPDWRDVSDGAHIVQFYESDAFLADSVAAFVAPALESAADSEPETAIVVAAEPRRDAIRRALEAHRAGRLDAHGRAAQEVIRDQQAVVVVDEADEALQA